MGISIYWIDSHISKLHWKYRRWKPAHILCYNRISAINDGVINGHVIMTLQSIMWSTIIDSFPQQNMWEYQIIELTVKLITDGSKLAPKILPFERWVWIDTENNYFPRISAIHQPYICHFFHTRDDIWHTRIILGHLLYSAPTVLSITQQTFFHYNIKKNN